MSRVLILIPAYNEAENLAGVVENIKKHSPQSDVLVVDDGSSDRTAEIASAASALVVSHPFNMGYGVTIQTGYKYAYSNGYDFIVQIDGDGQHDPSFIEDLLNPVVSGTVDFVVGSRFLGLDSYKPSIARRVGIALFRTIVSTVIRKKISDCTSGYQAFNRDVIGFFNSDLFPCDYPDADVLIALHRARFRIDEVPVRMTENQQGKSMHSGLKPAYYVVKMLLSILVTVLRSRKMYEEARKCQ